MNILIGEVSSVNADTREVRVFFEDLGMMSGWLKVIKNPPYAPFTENSLGGSGENAFEEHKHDINISPWLPDVGDIVLCIRNEGFNNDGYVLGAL